MNNTTATTTPTVIVAILMIATLVIGATFSAATHSASAYYPKKDDNGDKKDGIGNDNGNTVTIQANKQGVNNVPKILTGSQEPEDGSGEQGPNQQLRVREVLGQTTVLPPDTSTILSAVCGAGEVATGGGVSVVNQPPTSVRNELNHAFWIEHSIQGRGWMFTIQNPGPDPIRLEVYAECLSLVDVP